MITLTLERRLRLIRAGALLTFALIPVWYRVPQIPIFAGLYMTRFLILLPMLWTITCWLIFGLPGFKALRHDRLRQVWVLVFLVWALWAYASLAWAFMRLDHPEVGQSAALQLCIVALFVVAVACVGVPPRWAAAALIFGVAWNSVLIFAQVYHQGSLGLKVFGEFTFSPEDSGVSVIQAGDLRWQRPYGLLPHPNALAGCLVVGVLATGAWILSARRARRWLGVALAVMGIYALLLTFSRASWIGLAAGVFAVVPLLLPYIRRPVTRRALLVTAGLILVAGGIFFAAYRPLLAARTGEGGESIELRSISDRTVFLDFAFRSITESPARMVFGVGMGNFPWRTSYYLVETTYDLRGDNVHHVFVSAWAELGIVGVGLMVILLALGIEIALRELKALIPRPLLPQGEGGQVPRPQGERFRVRADDNYAARIALLAGALALIIIGLLDHYPWTFLQFQVAWWGGLAISGCRRG